MTKKQLYFVITVFAAGLLYLLFLQVTSGLEYTTGVGSAMEPITAVQRENLETKNTTHISEETDHDIENETTVVEGTFVGLIEGIDNLEKTFTYMLLHDGTEVLRIDLRPLVGYSSINLIKKLGVERGDEVRVVGTIREGEFTVETIE